MILETSQKTNLLEEIGLVHKLDVEQHKEKDIV